MFVLMTEKKQREPLVLTIHLILTLICPFLCSTAINTLINGRLESIKRFSSTDGISKKVIISVCR